MAREFYKTEEHAEQAAAKGRSEAASAAKCSTPLPARHHQVSKLMPNSTTNSGRAVLALPDGTPPSQRARPSVFCRLDCVDAS